jgi:hypothetical protein
MPACCRTISRAITQRTVRQQPKSRDLRCHGRAAGHVRQRGCGRSVATLVGQDVLQWHWQSVEDSVGSASKGGAYGIARGTPPFACHGLCAIGHGRMPGCRLSGLIAELAGWTGREKSYIVEVKSNEEAAEVISAAASSDYQNIAFNSLPALANGSTFKHNHLAPTSLSSTPCITPPNSA